MIKNKVSAYKDVLTLQAWDKQNKFKFDFIPLGNLKVPDKLRQVKSSEGPLVLRYPFLLMLLTVDTITNQIKILGKGCMLCKVDISRTFRHVKLVTGHYVLLGLHHIDWFVDTYLPFNYRHGSTLYQCLSDTVCHIMLCQNYDIINYVDDILGIHIPSQIDASYDFLC